MVSQLPIPEPGFLEPLLFLSTIAASEPSCIGSFWQYKQRRKVLMVFSLTGSCFPNKIQPLTSWLQAWLVAPDTDVGSFCNYASARKDNLWDVVRPLRRIFSFRTHRVPEDESCSQGESTFRRTPCPLGLGGWWGQGAGEGIGNTSEQRSFSLRNHQIAEDRRKIDSLSYPHTFIATYSAIILYCQGGQLDIGQSWK